MPDEGARAGAREWIGLAVLALPTLLLSLDMSVLFLALPHLAEDLHASATQQLWITDVYGFMVAGFVVTMGSVGDRIGHRKLCLIGAACFALGSAAAAYAPSAELLIVARALLGVAGATLLPTTMTLIRNMFHNPKQLGIAIAIWGTGFTAGGAIGPAVGGALLNTFWWGSVFLMAIPIMALVLIVGPMVLPEYRNEEQKKFDSVSMIQSFLAILPVIYGLKEIVKYGWGVLPVLAIVFGLVVGVFFVRRQNKLGTPFLDLRLFGNRILRAALIISLFTAVMQSGTEFMVSNYLQMVQGLSPLSAGLWLVLPALALIVSINATPHLVQRFKPVYPIATGMIIAVIGQVVLTQVTATASPAPAVVGLALIFFGVGPVAAQIPNMIMSSAPPERAGSAAGVMQVTGELGLALGIAVLGSVSALAYTLRFTPLADVPDAVNGAAHESVAGAVKAASQLPGGGAELLAHARDAFTAGVNSVGWVCAGMFLVAAVLAFVVLNRIERQGAAAAEEQPGHEAVAVDPVA